MIYKNDESCIVYLLETQQRKKVLILAHNASKIIFVKTIHPESLFLPIKHLHLLLPSP